MLSSDAESADSSAPELEKRVGRRFGVLPNFFRLAPETPEITEKLCGFAEAAYLDNPLPSLFKERLFVHLSRFCAVRYCIARHTGFLIGLGRPAGDKNARAQSIVEVVGLLQRPFPYGRELELRLSLCATCPAPLVEIPSADSQVEEAIFALAGHVFLQTTHASACLDALERLLGAVQLQYLLLFLAFVRTAHYWTKVHAEIEFEDDIKQLLATNEALANCILNDPETRLSLLSVRSSSTYYRCVQAVLTNGRLFCCFDCCLKRAPCSTTQHLRDHDAPCNTMGINGGRFSGWFGRL